MSFPVSVLEQLQATVADRLQTDALFATARTLPNGQVVSIAALPEYLGDLDSQCDTKIALVGIAAVVLTPDASAGSRKGEYGPVFERISVKVRIGENVVTNRGTQSVPSTQGSLVSALQLAERVCELLGAGWQPPGFSSLLIPEDPTILRARVPGCDDGREVSFSLYGSLWYQQQSLPALTITDSGGQVTITPASNVPGQAIFYTTGGSAIPAPWGAGQTPASATLYTGPFASGGPGTIVRANSWLAGYLPGGQVTHTTAS